MPKLDNMVGVLHLILIEKALSALPNLYKVPQYLHGTIYLLCLERIIEFHQLKTVQFRIDRGIIRDKLK